MINPIREFVAAVDRLRYLRRAMPVRDALRVMCAPKSRRDIGIFLKTIERCVYIRPGTSDLECLGKVFIHDEYRSPFEQYPKLIVDAGANIGMASLYFAHRYPQAQIVAIEPESSNFEMLRRNCTGVTNVILLQGALWPVCCPLEIENPTTEAWTFAITQRPSNYGGAAISAITIANILERTGAKKIDFLKLDIEGSELQLFSEGAEQWIDLVETIAIELHDRYRPGCAQAFYSVLASRKFIQEIRGENIFVKVLANGNLAPSGAHIRAQNT